VTVEISIEKLVQIIVREVLSELAKRGVAVGIPPAGGGTAPVRDPASRVSIDMTGYRTPVLTENRVRSLERHVREITVPPGTVCTIGARDVLQQRRIKLTFTGNTH
jgi:hypothetical protein